MRKTQGKVNAKKKLSFRVDFEGQDAEHVEFLKQKRGLKALSELGRQLITEEYNRVKQADQSQVQVPAR